jgi:hypothetical protein
MTRDDIIKMAREAGLYSGSPRTPSTGSMIEKRLERFAELVAAKKEKQIIDILRRLQERNDSHNYYAYAINVIKGEAHENPYLYTIRL